MRISELSAATGVPVPTIKYYLREKLLPEGERSSPTQAAYGDLHVRRLRVVRALIESGVSIADTRKVVAALDDPPSAPLDLLATAHSAVGHPTADVPDLRAAEALVARLGWSEGRCDPAQLAEVARALDALERAGFDVPEANMNVYLEGIRRMAEAEIAGVPGDSAEAAVRYLVFGTVLIEPLLLALRRVAEQVVAGERFAPVSRPSA